jgi:hypothetical protein
MGDICEDYKNAAQVFVHSMDIHVFRVRVCVLGSAEIINTNPATMSKRRLVIPVPAIAWLDLMQLTS